MALVSDTSPPPTRATAALKPPKAWRTRNLSLDRTRTFLTLLVLIHHAVIPYTHFGHTDGASWLGFDFVVLATDSFFMAMFFFLSGLFLWPSLSHRAPGVFARDRLVRLGIPFAVAAVTIIPIAYYAIALRENDGLSFTAFWWKTITVGPWPSGPLWFLWVLLIYSVVGGAMCRLFPHCLAPITRLSERGFARPLLVFAVFVVIAIVIYVRCGSGLGRTTGSSSGHSRFRKAAFCCTPPISSWARASAPAIWKTVCSAPTAASPMSGAIGRWHRWCLMARCGC